jgi:lipopolysaccharide transport system ATP-binding protein
MGAVQRLCSRAILLREGSVVCDDRTNVVLNKYLSQDIEENGERVWSDSANAPGDDVVRLLAVRAYNEKGEICREFNLKETFSLEVEFLVIESVRNLYVSIVFFDDFGNRIFAVGDFQAEEWQDKERLKGIHTSRCTIPKDLLNQGNILIQVGITTEFNTLRLLERDVISLKLIDDYKPGGARGNNTNEWTGGVIRPLLSWSFDYKPVTE